MRKVLIATISFLVPICAILLFSLLKENQKIIFRSDIDGFELSRSNEFGQFEKFLDDMNFWQTSAVTSTDGKLPKTAKKLEVIVTNQKQIAGYLAGGANNEIVYSSYGYKEEDGHITYTIHIDKSLCQMADCDIDTTINKQLIRGIYGTVTKGKSDYLRDIWAQYNGKYVTLRDKPWWKITLVKSAYAQACASWFCGIETVNSDGSISCGPGGFDDEATTCGPGCPSGYCVKDYTCSCGGDEGGGGGGGGSGGGPACFTGIDCPAGTVRGSTLLSTRCDFHQCTNSLGTAQKRGDCCQWYEPDPVCGEWYNCPTPSNPNKMCRDCEQDPGYCRKYNYETYNCVSVCSATAPTNVTFTPISLTSARLTWTPGTGGTTQFVYIGSNKADVEANCASGNCAVSVDLGSATQSSYDTPQVLVPGTVYYYRVVNSESISCATPSATGTHLQSCTLSPTTLSLSASQTAVITASVASSTEIQRVDFASSNPSVASVSPSSDNSYPFTATVTANATGSATITATVYYTGGAVACQTGSGSFPGSQNTNVTVANLSAWWQVRDGDVTASVTELVCALG